MQTADNNIEVFMYPADEDAAPGATWKGWINVDEHSVSDAAVEQNALRTLIEAELCSAWELRLEEEAQKSFEMGRLQGIEEGCRLEQEKHALAMTALENQCRVQVAEWMAAFAEVRDQYMQDIEHEVVKLALTVAARILRREAKMDPLLLTGAVRVALGQLSSKTEVQLRVPARDFDLWNETMAILPHLAKKPAVKADDGMRLGDCVLETKLGSVDLGVSTQLAEIERGFFDRVVVVRDGSPPAEVLS